MEKRTLGTSDVQITPILMGTWQAGKKMWVGIEDADSIKTIRAAFEAGITTVDTAEVYGEGHSERIVAEALSDVRVDALSGLSPDIAWSMPRKFSPTISSTTK
ncbi:hypothetical protein A6770_28510 [Nostoc minutum NIES-26]|uniref:NADP-dependent oxidoreductase domain-containing protein n=1 Tax=Nostoc minutum NIES-26 TaxID=1844469 RepID=A0A367QM97_9NOSO|nr:hypothetical protein A6770_28510 [Nostoc minutum NIES-26]